MADQIAQDMVSQIEEGIVCKLETDLKQALGLRTVATYGGQLDSEAFKEVIRAYPAVWVTYAGSAKPDKISSNQYKVPAKFVTIVATRNLRDEKSSRHGSKFEIGAYQLIDQVKQCLRGQCFDLDIKKLRIGAVKTLFNTKTRDSGVAAFSIEWETYWLETEAQQSCSDDGNEQYLLEVGLNYYIKPGDDDADVSDMVTLSNEESA